MGREEKDEIKALRLNILKTYYNKYFSIFYNNYKFEGDIEFEAQDYLKRQFWNVGTVSAFKVKKLDLIYYAPYCASYYNNYDFPTKATVINKHNESYYPKGEQEVHKDIVLGWALSTHLSIKKTCKYYIERIVQIEMVLNTNLTIHKLPFLVGVTPTDRAKAEALIKRILNDEVVVFVDLNDLNLVKALATQTPYICDKLYQLRISYENELLTILGVDNAMLNLSGERNTVDEVNANNSLIDVNTNGIVDNLTYFFEEIKKLFGANIIVKSHKPTKSVHETGLGNTGTYEGNDGGKETQQNEERLQQ